MKSENAQTSIQIGQLKAGSLLFKIFGFRQFTFEKAYSHSKVDWSGFYTQLNPQHSMRYLTKKWDDGADEACLVLIKPLKSLKLIKVKDNHYFSNPKIPGEQKALKIKQKLRKITLESDGIENYEIKEEEPLVKALGERCTLLECIDMQENEIIIPHDLLNENYFSFQNLLVFRKSQDGLLRTIGWQWAKKQCENQNQNMIKGQSQYEPYLLLKQNQQIKSFLTQIQVQSLTDNG